MSTPTLLGVRGSFEVCRELGIPAWFLERVLREEGMTIQRIGNARAWTDADVARLREGLAVRAARRSRRRTETPQPEHGGPIVISKGHATRHEVKQDDRVDSEPDAVRA